MASATDYTEAEQALCIKGHTGSTDVFIRHGKQASTNDDRNIKSVTKIVENNCVVSQCTCSPSAGEHVSRTSVTRYLPQWLCSNVQSTFSCATAAACGRSVGNAAADTHDTRHPRVY
jgi:hypothetical protein